MDLSMGEKIAIQNVWTIGARPETLVSANKRMNLSHINMKTNLPSNRTLSAILSPTFLSTFQ